MFYRQVGICSIIFLKYVPVLLIDQNTSISLYVFYNLFPTKVCPDLTIWIKIVSVLHVEPKPTSM